MLRLAFDFIIAWRETRTRPNAYIETIAGCRIMYFFAGEGMIAAKGKSASRTMTAVSAQHASTFGEPIVR